MPNNDPPLLHIYHSDDLEDVIDRLVDLLESHFSLTMSEVDDPDSPPSCHTTYLLESLDPQDYTEDG